MDVFTHNQHGQFYQPERLCTSKLQQSNGWSDASTSSRSLCRLHLVEDNFGKRYLVDPHWVFACAVCLGVNRKHKMYKLVATVKVWPSSSSSHHSPQNYSGSELPWRCTQSWMLVVWKWVEHCQQTRTKHVGSRECSTRARQFHVERLHVLQLPPLVNDPNDSSASRTIPVRATTSSALSSPPLDRRIWTWQVDRALWLSYPCQANSKLWKDLLVFPL